MPLDGFDTGKVTKKKGGRLARRPVPGSLGLLPSGPDPVGEWLVHHQPPEAHIVNSDAKSKRNGKKTVI
jgi:hypothetical protein